MRLKSGLFKYQVLSDKEKKNLLLLDIIIQKGPISRTDISKETDLNIVTVSNYVNNYIEKGLVIEKGFDVSSGGRKPTLVELDASGGYAIGVDIGPIDETAIMTDLSAKIMWKEKKKRPQGNMEEVIKVAAELLKDTIANSKVPKEKIIAVGFGISGIIDENSGTVRDTDPNRGRTTGSLNSFRETIEGTFNLPVFVGNDATCAAFGEKRLSLERGIENMLYIYSDVGCGIIIKGDIYCGAGGSAGEMQISSEAIGENDTKAGSKEMYYLRPLGVDLGIVAKTKKAIEEGIGTKVLELASGKAADITLEKVIKAAEVGDKLAMDLIENAGVSLGTRIAYLINLFNPEVVVIGGGIEKAGELIIEPIRRTVRKLAFEEPAAKVRIIPSALRDEAVALGAASLVLREVFTQV
ncbi:MAG: ROK family protein [Candidatus Omnitrophica bacterium]|nr:ROK family protein [Candidatus Omnitrophota bacterium]MBU4488426.1 ROK family protein [Candidatus Omnitrophota bacterium]MCG2704942.1 ROK family protein [Candidatus Omnitrophota bacterium]